MSTPIISRRTIRNRDWVRQSFMVPEEDIKRIPEVYRYYHTALVKFVDGTPGGNICINPLPQPTLFADPPPDGSHSLRVGSHGLGSLYSEVFDDNKQVIHMRFGVPAFNSLESWLKTFYSPEAARLARTGRAPSALFYVGKAVGFVVSLMFWPLLAANLIWRAAKFFFNKPSSKFYYLKPAMTQYWSAVQTIVNHIAVNMGITLHNSGKDSQGNPTSPELNEDYTGDPIANRRLHEAFPDVIEPNGYIDVFKMASKAQRLVNKQDEMINSLEMERAYGNINELANRFRAIYTTKMSATGGRSFQEYQDSWLKTQIANPEGGSDPTGEAIDVTYDDASMWDFFKAEWNDGSSFVSFRVNNTGTVTESFSNEFKASEMGEKINSIAAQNRSRFFDFANGNVGDGIVADTVEAVTGGLMDVINGVGTQMGMAGLAVLGGAAYADLPKHWESSSMNMSSSTYTMDLISYSGDKVSQLVHLWIPVAMILAGSLPLAAGKHAHTAPFLCEYYDKGKCQTRLGMIKSLTIERGGATNITFNSDNRAMSVRVSFQIEHLEPIMAVPITEGFSLTDTLKGMVLSAPTKAIGAAFNTDALDNTSARLQALGQEGTGLFDDDTIFSDYMSIIGSVSLRHQIYAIPKLKKRIALANYKSEQIKSESYWALLATEMFLPFHGGFRGAARLDQGTLL